MKRRKIIILHTSDQLANLLGADLTVIEHLISRMLHPPWIWTRRMSQPRWPDSSIPHWKRILASVEFEPNGSLKLPDHPSKVFYEKAKKIKPDSSGHSSGLKENKNA